MSDFGDTVHVAVINILLVYLISPALYMIYLSWFIKVSECHNLLG